MKQINFLPIWILSLVCSLQSFSQQRTAAPYYIEDIAANGSHLWMTGSSDQHGAGVYHYAGQRWSFYPVEYARSITTTRNNEPVVLTQDGQVLLLDHGQWQVIGYGAEDITRGIQGGLVTAYKQGKIQIFRQGNWEVYRTGPLAIMDIASGLNTPLYAVNRAGSVYLHRNGRWVPIQGVSASSISVGADGKVYATNDQVSAGGSSIIEVLNNKAVPTPFKGQLIVTDINHKKYLLDEFGRLFVLENGGKTQLTLDKIGGTRSQAEAFDYGDDVAAVDSITGETSLYRAIENDDLTGIYTLLANKSDINHVNRKGETPLLAAVKSNRTDAALALIRLKADPRKIDHKKKDAMHYAVLNMNIPVVQALVRHGVPTDSHLLDDVLGMKIHPRDRSAMVSNLLTGGARVKPSHLLNATSMADFPTFILLSEAAEFQNLRVDYTHISQRAFEAGAGEILYESTLRGGDPNLGLEFGLSQGWKELTMLSLERGAAPEPALRMAITENDPTFFKRLIQHYKASPDIALEESIFMQQQNFTFQALDLGANPNAGIMPSIEISDTTAFKLMMTKGARLDHPDYMALGAEKGDLAMVNLLLAYGADAHDGLLPAVKAEHPYVLQRLLDTASAMNPVLIEQASSQGATEIIEVLLDAGANPQFGLAPAVAKNHTAPALLLMEQGAIADQPILISQVARVNNLVLASALIDAQADPSDGIVTAVQSNHFKMVQLLTENGADLTRTDDRQNNLLHIAAKREHYQISEYLLKTGKVEIDAVNNDGHTPLMIVVMGGRGEEIDLTRLYVESGADINARDRSFDPVYKLAKGRKVKKYLKKQGADKK